MAASNARNIITIIDTKYNDIGLKRELLEFAASEASEQEMEELSKEWTDSIQFFLDIFQDNRKESLKALVEMYKVKKRRGDKEELNVFLNKIKRYIEEYRMLSKDEEYAKSDSVKASELFNGIDNANEFITDIYADRNINADNNQNIFGYGGRRRKTRRNKRHAKKTRRHRRNRKH